MTAALDWSTGRVSTGRRIGTAARRVAAPVVVAVLVGLVFLWVSTLHLDSIEQRTLNPEYITARIREHLVLTVVASALVALLAIPAGIAVHRVRAGWFRAIVLGLGNIGQATPAVGVVILLAIVWQTGFLTALVALVAYSFLPVLRNTLIGLEQVNADAKEAARGMGMTPGQVLRQIELPLASPTILAGLRTSLVFCVGVATVATFINAVWAGILIRAGRSDKSPALVADGQHIMTDVVTSVGVFIGLVGAVLPGWRILDPALAVIVALNILWQGWHVIGSSLNGLMDRAVDIQENIRIRDIISANSKGAIEVHDLKTRIAGRATFIEFHLIVDGDMPVRESHLICDRIEDALKAEIPSVRVVIHVEPDDEAKLPRGTTAVPFA